MKLNAIVLALLCVVVYATAEEEKRKETSRWLRTLSVPYRFRRDTQNSITANVAHGEVPQLSIDANINKYIFDNGRIFVDLTENASIAPGSEPQLNGQLDILHEIGENSFLRAYGNLEPDGNSTRNFGLNGVFRFKRDADPPKNSINFQGSQPLSGRNRQPSWDLNFNRNIANNDRTRADVFGGVSKVPGQRAQPHIGVQAERNFGKNGFIRGFGQLQPGRGGRGVSRSFGITGGFRFRREAEPQFT
ncbi:PREDICTED: uncharacterized protein LOC106740878 [Dinoponera quadriceps]|uniref:Uncharacterized protein LOC106740878 n=1 Tax=Dinoponera quadriceps TaxID=609295 RepID=A0A6P3WP57_DINQU|nr:PREDICTED: uncharacterized protein LOC106740878 [Dinoponera quadriceps]